jgi:Tfp pilus assembly protein PilX
MNSRRQQQGAVLIVSLIMLVVLTLFAVSGINLSSVNLKIVGNMQAQKRMEMAAQNAIEQMLSSATYFNLTPAAQTVNVDGYNVSVAAPVCTQTAPATGYSATSGISPEDNDWELVATVSDALSGASVTIHQGVRIRMLAGNCP